MLSVVLLFGSNATNASELVERAIRRSEEEVGAMQRLSAEYRSEPYGFTAESEFVNRAAEFLTEEDAYEVLRRINLIEAELGRDRAIEREVQQQMGERYASRPIDIDIIFYGDLSFNDERLTIPYHFLAEREYALRPLVEIAPDREHPALEHTPREMLEMLTKNEL